MPVRRNVSRLSEADLVKLRRAANLARRNAYAPYSRFPVGAAVKTKDGRIFAGCNVENSSYGLTSCAERNAIFQAIASGAKEIVAVVVAGGRRDPAPPCGACRQVISEFGPGAELRSYSTTGRDSTWTMSYLLPSAFTKAAVRPSRHGRAGSRRVTRRR